MDRRSPATRMERKHLMNRKLKTLGLALVAALALTAVLASAAQAQFTSTAENTEHEGSQATTHNFTLGAGGDKISCSTSTFKGTNKGTFNSGSGTYETQSITVKPTFAGCVDPFGNAVEVLKNSLEYHFLSGPEKGKMVLTGELETTVKDPIAHCTINVKGNQTLNGISYTNNADGTVTITTTTNNITTTFAGGFFACGNAGTHSNAGTYSGTTTLKGFSGGEQKNLKVD
jgi:hypothetical protein